MMRTIRPARIIYAVGKYASYGSHQFLIIAVHFKIKSAPDCERPTSKNYGLS